ncbi:maleylpyruvate isomerase N-terminal domain-containing protein [Aquihabitans sp. G128]|uniref:maleylpyruvate isomerase family mycothiol-dependent enzyme n=1 Tax=Aquihabitans sp. G128 TaxID=2849779 RepID=UPI001C22CB65|nr:maleylpyruvate isomerase family mycothiol-dependent enzyme [Aquihabitans sp. G128]QXC60029.1 maleylpyruvate isomerase N-terminal domain-containing protein [Aquihabitans sp. G128]
MADHIFDLHETAAAFRFSSTWYRSLVGAVDDHRWDQAALGEWSVRELVVHTARAYKTIVEYLDGPVHDETQIYSAAGYLRTVLAEQTPHVHIAARAKREAADALDPVGMIDEWSAKAEKRVAVAAADEQVNLFVGQMTLDQYLATRVVELVVHGLDLAAAIDLPTPAPAGAARVAMQVLLDLAPPEDLSSILCLMTGRAASLPLTHVLD